MAIYNPNMKRKRNTQALTRDNTPGYKRKRYHKQDMDPEEAGYDKSHIDAGPIEYPNTGDKL